MKEKNALPILVLRFDTESAYALRQEPENNKNWTKWISESLSAVQRITEILDEFKVPATFFIVGKLLEKAGDQYAALLGNNDLIDAQSHTFSHSKIKRPQSLEQLGEELDKTSQLLVKYFHKPPIGICAPGNHVDGLQGCRDVLKLIWERGYRFLGSDGAARPQKAGGLGPAPFKQPYWYAHDGYPGLLELPLTGWHCNMLTNSGGQNGLWQPDVSYPDGGILEKLPRTELEAFAVRKRELEWAMQNKLIYSPCIHPWSIYRFGRKLEHLQMLIRYAREHNVTIMNAIQLYEFLKDKKNKQ